MPYIDSVAIIDFPCKVQQGVIKQHVRSMFAEGYPLVEKALDIFDNAEISSRNLCKPLDYYLSLKGFAQQNSEYIKVAVEYSALAVADCAQKAKVKLSDITDILVVSTTGLATPSLDALIINKLRLDPHINRIPIWGLGCGGGVSGVAKAGVIAAANPQAVVLLVAVELCSLTYLKDDFSKSNFVASSLFSDGIAALIIKGDQCQTASKVKIHSSRSTFFYDTEDIMGWDFQDTGFRVIFSRDIPSFITKNLGAVVNGYLAEHNIGVPDIQNFIFHPGGKKVLNAYAEALHIEAESLATSRAVIGDYGNMSSPTVLYVLERFMREDYTPGWGLMSAMGPGFCVEKVLLEME